MDGRATNDGAVAFYDGVCVDFGFQLVARTLHQQAAAFQRFDEFNDSAYVFDGCRSNRVIRVCVDHRPAPVPGVKLVEQGSIDTPVHQVHAVDATVTGLHRLPQQPLGRADQRLLRRIGLGPLPAQRRHDDPGDGRVRRQRGSPGGRHRPLADRESRRPQDGGQRREIDPLLIGPQDRRRLGVYEHDSRHLGHQKRTNRGRDHLLAPESPVERHGALADRSHVHGGKELRGRDHGRAVGADDQKRLTALELPADRGDLEHRKLR